MLAKFVGTYMVYDTINLTSWQMHIHYTTDTNINNGYIFDCLDLVNFANEFNFKNQFNCGIISTYLSLGILYPITNHSGKRYNLTINNENPNTPYLENNLKNDTIVFYFRKKNLQYYFDDGVSYEDAYHTHIAVKQH